jgi:pimeloyl-ACP methyl ester carboxylesterase
MLTTNTRSPALVDRVWRDCFYDKAVFRACTAYQTARAAMLADLRWLDISSLRLWFYQMRLVGDLTPHLPAITAPVLAMAGRRDGIVPAEQASIIGRGVPHGTTVLLDNLDHALYMEQPERVAQSMREWIEALPV